jgi:iron complex outermembrane receptor protein
VNVSDLILNAQVRVPPNLSDRKVLNLGEMENSGLEVTINYDAFRTESGFTYSPALVFTKFFETTIKSITSDETTGDGTIELGDLGAPFLTGVTTVEVVEGQALGGIIGPRYNGLNESNEITLVDANGDGVPDDFVLGNGLPSFQIGLNNTFTYKNFDLNFFLRGVFGHDLLNVNNAKYGVPASVAIQNGTKQALDFIDATNGPIFSDQHVESASFVKLDNATLGYTFDLESNSIRKLRVFVTGQNLFVITDYTGVDPEPRFDDGGNPLAPGIDRENTYITTRAVSVGVNLNF